MYCLSSLMLTPEFPAPFVPPRRLISFGQWDLGSSAQCPHGIFPPFF
jgi:hypothetical protein